MTLGTLKEYSKRAKAKIAARREVRAGWPDGPEGAGVLGWLLGSLEGLHRDPIQFFHRAMLEHGDFVPIRVAYQQLFLVSDPDLLKLVLQDQHRKFDKGSPGAKSLRFVLRGGLITAEGEHWRRQRKLAQPAFHRECIRRFGALMGEEAKRLGDAWSAREGETIDVMDGLMTATLEVVGKALFGADLGTHASTVGRAVPVVLDELRQRALPILPMPLIIPTPGNRRFRAAVEALDQVVTSVLAARRGPREEATDLLDMLMLARDDERNTGMTDGQLRDELLTFMLVGHETTALALAWTFLLLEKHRDVEEKLRLELADVLGGRAPTYDDVPKLVYTRAVFMEAIRIYPPGWMMSRRALEDVQVGPYMVPKGALVLISPYVLHRNPRVFREPDAFRPERFLPDQVEQKHRFAFLGFGAGPRVCIGAQFAEVEGVIFLAELLQRVRFELAARRASRAPGRDHAAAEAWAPDADSYIWIVKHSFATMTDAPRGPQQPADAERSRRQSGPSHDRRTGGARSPRRSSGRATTGGAMRPRAVSCTAAFTEPPRRLPLTNRIVHCRPTSSSIPPTVLDIA